MEIRPRDRTRCKNGLTKVEQGSKDEAQGQWDDDMSISAFGIVNHQQWNRCNYRYRQFVPPPDVKYVVQEPKHCCH